MRTSILRSTSYNFLGQVVPTTIAVVTVPALIAYLGAERVGLLTIIWAIVGYFSILDLGLGFAVTRSVSEALARDKRESVPPLFWGAMLTQVGLGVVGGCAFAIGAPYLASKLRIGATLVPETVGALYLCAAALPVLVCSSTVVGLLHAAQRFDVSATIQIPLSSAQYLLPLLVALVTPDMRWIVAGLLGTRAVGLALTFRAASAEFPDIRRRTRLDRSLLADQLRFGGWMTVSNVLSPAMVYLDRLLIGAMMSVTQVAYYAVPMDAVMKVSAIPNSLSTVLFSVFSHRSSVEEDRATGVLQGGFRWLLLVLAVPMAVAIVFSHDVLTLWLGAEFAGQGTTVLRIFLVGIFANSLTRVPFVYVTSSGRADLVAKVMAIQAPLQLGAAYALIRLWGLTGAALVWSGRLVLELAIYLVLSERISGRRMTSSLARESVRPLLVVAVVLIVGYSARALTTGLVAHFNAAAGVLLGGLLLLYLGCLNADERRRFMSIVRRS